MITLENVSKAYSTGAPALNNVSLKIEAGEFVFVVGDSGSGKSTLIKLLLRELLPTSGKIMVNDIDVASLRHKQIPKYRRKLGVVFQDFRLLKDRNVYENVAFAQRIVQTPSKEIKKNVPSILSTVGLAGKYKARPKQLSGGEQQRVAIARALVNRPKVLLLDEPLGALDLRLRKDMQNELKRIQQQMGITFIYVTHDQEEALTMSDTVVVMDKGRIQQIGTPEDIYNEPKNAFVADFIGESNILNGTMVRDNVVKMYGKEFPCVDGGFEENEPVDVVIRPEDIDVVSPKEGHLIGKVTAITFKGLNYDIIVEFKGFKWLIQSTDYQAVGSTIGIRLNPEDIHIMHKSEYSGLFGDYSSYSAEYDELTEDAGNEED